MLSGIDTLGRSLLRSLDHAVGATVLLWLALRAGLARGRRGSRLVSERAYQQVVFTGVDAISTRLMYG
jgi:hypothetical protein